MPTATKTKADILHGQILNAAQKLFKHNGFHKVTMDDIAKAVGKGRSSLYYYYKRKDEVFYAVTDIEINDMIAGLARDIAKVSGLEQKIQAFYINRLKNSRKGKVLYNTIDAGIDAEEMSYNTKVKHTLHRRMMAQQSALLKQILIHGIENEELKPLNDIELNDLIFIMLSSLNGIKNEIAIEHNFAGIEPVVAALTRTLMYGINR